MAMRVILAAFLLLFSPVGALAAPAAPAVTLTPLDGQTAFDSRALIGKKVLVVRFQASWCRVCPEEAARLERVWKEYGPRGVEVIGIQVQDTEADARRFLKAQGVTYPAGLDPRLRIANRFAITGTPYTVIVDKRGTIAARIPGRIDETRLGKQLDAVLQEPPKRTPPSRLQ